MPDICRLTRRVADVVRLAECHCAVVAAAVAGGCRTLGLVRRVVTCSGGRL